MIQACGNGATILLSNLSSTPDSATVNGVQVFLQGLTTISFPCSGNVDVITSASLSVQLLPSPMVDWGQAMSFLAGLLVALAFASASLKKW